MTQTTKILTETLVPLDSPKGQLVGNPTQRQLANWRLIGLSVPGTRGERRRVRLEWCQIGLRRYTSVEAYGRFLREVNQEGKVDG